MLFLIRLIRFLFLEIFKGGGVRLLPFHRKKREAYVGIRQKEAALLFKDVLQIVGMLFEK